MGEQRLGDVKGEAAEEDGEHEDPLDVFEQGAEEGFLADSVAHDCQGDVAEAIEDNDDREPDLPGVDVVLVEVSVEPADGEVIHRGHDPGSADGVVGTNVGDDGDLGGEADVGEEETAEERGEGTLIDPSAHRVEEELVASICVFFPSGQLIIHGERDTFLESFTGPSGETDDVAIALETQRHVKVFGDVGFRPEFLIPIFVDIGDLLNGGPAKHGVMTNEGSDIAIGNGVFDSSIDKVGEEGDAVLEVIVDNLHDT